MKFLLKNIKRKGINSVKGIAEATGLSEKKTIKLLKIYKKVKPIEPFLRLGGFFDWRDFGSRHIKDEFETAKRLGYKYAYSAIKSDDSIELVFSKIKIKKLKGTDEDGAITDGLI